MAKPVNKETIIYWYQWLDGIRYPILSESEARDKRKLRLIDEGRARKERT